MGTGMRFGRALSRTLKRLRRHHFPGAFAGQIFDLLRDETFSSQTGGGPLYVHIKSVERGNNPFHENFNVRFQLVASPSSWTSDQIEIETQPAGVIEHFSSVGLPGGGPIVLASDFFFQFSSAQSVAKNLERFRDFVGHRSTNQAASPDAPPIAVKFGKDPYYSAVADANLPAGDDLL